MKQEIKEKLINKIEQRVVLPEVAMIARVEASLIKGASKYCEDKGYQLILVPHLTKATGACENFSTLFSTSLFEETAYLNQTGQLMLEAFMESFGKTYCWGPSFRKEQKADERHLCEFPLFEIEVADCDLEKLKTEISNIFGNMIDYVEKNCYNELRHLTGNTLHLDELKPPYNSIEYKEAIKKLNSFGLKFGDDLKAEHEQELVRLNNGKPLFITHYPQQIKFFNMRLNRTENLVVNSMDLIMPYSGEAVGAAEREEDFKILLKRLRESDMLRLLKEEIKNEQKFVGVNEGKINEEAEKRFEWYLNIIKEKPIRHAGCGIGINRVTQAILKASDIRHSTAFPLNRETLF
ncbi:MAG: hypothetical protein PHG05_01920 [Candidatus Nanoarchaeia archaeon]|nr:hypothetical protein [Candidatus Nanoarchaeia archaeon]